MNELTGCKTCGREISVLADACPGCGAPNDWVHDDIRRFVAASATIPTKRPFSYVNNKTILNGHTAPRVPLWAWAGCAILFLGSMLGFILFGWVGAIIPGVGCAIVMRLTQRADYFQADLVARTWSSSNERFWAPVRQALKL